MQRHREQRYEINANCDITFTRLSDDYEIEAAIVSYEKWHVFNQAFLKEILDQSSQT